MSARATIGALRGETSPRVERKSYTGKTYNSADAVAEFFRNRSGSSPSTPPREAPKPQPSAYERLKAAGSRKPKSGAEQDSNALLPGTNVIHAKYGRGLILRREGSGDNVKLTISFPGFGQKKLIEKFANLQKDQ